MTRDSAVNGVLREHQSCCITDSYEENRCGLDVRGLEFSNLIALHGTNYQLNHNWQGRLCDRIIMGSLDENFVCAVEFKGGRSADIATAVEQIQGGLNLAAALRLGSWAAEWHPILVYSGSVPRDELNVLQRRQVTYRNQKRLVRRIDCGSRLLDHLNKPQ